MTTNDYQWLPMTINDYQWLPITTNDYWWLPMTTDDYRWLSDDYQMTIWWLSDDYPMTIRWLSDDYQMTIWWLTDDYQMTIQWLSNAYLMTIQWLSRTFNLFFGMIINLKRSTDRRWLFGSGATFIVRWSWFLSLYPLIAYTQNCLNLSQNVKYSTFIANVTKNLTYAV